MKICILVATAFLCFQTTQIAAERDKSRGCRSGRCKYKSNRLRFLRDLSKTMYPGTDVIGITLKALHNQKEGTFATYDAAESRGYDIPKIAPDITSGETVIITEVDKEATIGSKTMVEASFLCPKSDDDIDMLPCPTPDIYNRIHCINYYSLCDRKLNCPNGEDEDSKLCLFHSAVDHYINQLKNIMYRLNRKTEQMIHTQQQQYDYLDYNNYEQ